MPYDAYRHCAAVGTAMTRSKELRRIERAVEHQDHADLRWALDYCEMRLRLVSSKQGVVLAQSCQTDPRGSRRRNLTARGPLNTLRRSRYLSLDWLVDMRIGNAI
jgi:hypothetical protein